SRVKYMMKGYSSPKPFGMDDLDKCIAYDMQVVDHWLQQLEKYTQGNVTITNQAVLELGPGSDLGTGLYLLAKGCKKYMAADVNNLVAATPPAFYHRLIEKLTQAGYQNLQWIEAAMQAAQAGQPGPMHFVATKDFDLVKAFGTQVATLVFSQAAFEHFDDIESSFAQLSQVCKAGTTLIAEVDLQTHSRWIRDADPNNIYRYPQWVYRLFWFSGSPNRKRPADYKRALENHGWRNVQIIPLKQDLRFLKNRRGLSATFKGEVNQMQILTMMLCATKAS
ncbi:MAG TPA: hypothetical protein PKD90_20195, partial [Phnomibacter sp.]|nr:hypothetical protein [Phnomibacter sp.]